VVDLRPGDSTTHSKELRHTDDADSMFAATTEILGRKPEHPRRTLFHDQGRAIARHTEHAEQCGIDICFADALSPWQDPTNESVNGLLRRFVGKGAELGIYPLDLLCLIDYRLNTIP
jgi:IS30 family transposase